MSSAIELNSLQFNYLISWLVKYPRATVRANESLLQDFTAYGFLAVEAFVLGHTKLSFEAFLNLSQKKIFKYLNNQKEETVKW